MDTETALAEAGPTAVNTMEPLDGAPSARPKIHHFTLYGRANRGDLAAFAAAKVWLESAVPAARRGTDGRAVRGGLEAGPVRHYVVRFMTGGRIATRGVDGDFGSVPPLLGSMSRRERHADEHADIEEAQTEFVIAVRLGPKRAGNIPGAISREGSLGQGIFDFTVVNGSLIHCIRTSSGRPTMAA